MYYRVSWRALLHDLSRKHLEVQFTYMYIVYVFVDSTRALNLYFSLVLLLLRPFFNGRPMCLRNQLGSEIGIFNNMLIIMCTCVRYQGNEIHLRIIEPRFSNSGWMLLPSSY